MKPHKGLFTPRTSKAVKSDYYDAGGKVLYLTFPSGNTYAHDGFPPEMYAEFASTDSHGAFYNSRIKGAFPATKVTIDEPPDQSA